LPFDAETLALGTGLGLPWSQPPWQEWQARSIYFAKVEKLVGELGDDNPQVRDTATAELAKMYWDDLAPFLFTMDEPDPSDPALGRLRYLEERLTEAAKDDPEVEWRAKLILRKSE
jgi:hypothetical protein